MAETKTRTATIRQLDPMTPEDLSEQDLLLIYDVDQRDDHDPKAAARAKKFTVKDFKKGLQHGHRIVEGLQYEIDEKSTGNTLKIKAVDKLDTYASDRYDGIISSETYGQIQTNKNDINDLKNKDTQYHINQDGVESWLPVKEIVEDPNSIIKIDYQRYEGDNQEQEVNRLIIGSNYLDTGEQPAFTRIRTEDQNGSINITANTSTSELKIKGQGSIGIKQNENSPNNEIVFYLQAGEAGADVKIKTPDDIDGTNFIDRLATIIQGEGISFEKEGTQGLKINAIDTSIKIIPCLVDQENNQNTEHDLSRYINVDLNTQKIIPVYFEQTPSVNEQFYDPDNNYLHETGMSFIVNGENSYPIYHNDHPYYPSQKLIKHFGLFLFYNQNGISRFYLIGSDGQGKNAESEDSSSSPTVIINVDPGQIETKNNCDYRTIKFKDQGDNVYASVQVLTDIHKDQSNGVAGLDENARLDNHKLNIFTDPEAAEPKIDKAYIPNDIAEKNEAYIVNYKDDVGITIPDGAMPFDLNFIGTGGGGGSSEGSSLVATCTSPASSKNKDIYFGTDPIIKEGTLIAVWFSETFNTRQANLIINRNTLDPITGSICYSRNTEFPAQLITSEDWVLFLTTRVSGAFQFEIIAIDSIIQTSIDNIYIDDTDIYEIEASQTVDINENPYSLLRLKNGKTFQLPRTLFEKVEGEDEYRINKDFFPENLFLQATIPADSEQSESYDVTKQINTIIEGEGINFTFSDIDDSLIINSTISLPTEEDLDEGETFSDLVLSGTGDFVNIQKQLFEPDNGLYWTPALSTIISKLYPVGSVVETYEGGKPPWELTPTNEADWIKLTQNTYTVNNNSYKIYKYMRHQES